MKPHDVREKDNVKYTGSERIGICSSLPLSKSNSVRVWGFSSVANGLCGIGLLEVFL